MEEWPLEKCCGRTGCIKLKEIIKKRKNDGKRREKSE